ncbi:hypothetical protein KY326_04320 [Candidatus Woesearchaeota archaeon]|nr:hypothetical protein [Candidatus Woesearchaeota archaeon]
MTTEEKSPRDLLEERATIVLPRLSLEELEKLLDHLGEHLPATVTYSVHEDSKCIYGLHRKEGEELQKRPGSFRVSGTIHAQTTGSMFKCRFEDKCTDEEYISVAVALRFETVGFDRIEEFRKEEVQLWDNAKQLAGDYFL